MEHLPKRLGLRLPRHDYSHPGGYFVTICTKDRSHCLASAFVGHDDLGVPQMELTEIGRMAEKWINSIPAAYPNVILEQYVVMPNHVHLFLRIAGSEAGAPGSSRPTQLLSRVIAALKRFTNREAGQSLWQTSYYDHVIRNEADAFRVREYMENNPARWQEDRYYTADLP